MNLNSSKFPVACCKDEDRTIVIIERKVMIARDELDKAIEIAKRYGIGKMYLIGSLFRARYPDYKNRFYRKATGEFAKSDFDETNPYIKAIIETGERII